MKTRIFNLLALISLVSVVGFSSCQKDEIEVENFALKSMISIQEESCTPKVSEGLFAGMAQTQLGNVLISNSENFLFVEFIAADGSEFGKTHLDISANQPTAKGAPGKYKFNKYEVVSLSTSTYRIYQVPLSALPECFFLLTHAEVGSETAYSGDFVNAPRGAWFNYRSYCVEECDETEVITKCEGETAWAAGNRYETPSNWATYTAYAEGSVKLFAGQTHDAGTVAFSAVVIGKVTITITLNEGFSFQAVAENIKIQDYAYAPSGNPAIGGFAHKASVSGVVSYSMEVPANHFYGVHVDVLRCWEVK